MRAPGSAAGLIGGLVVLGFVQADLGPLWLRSLLTVIGATGSALVAVRLRSSDLRGLAALIPAAVVGAGLQAATGLPWQAAPGGLLAVLVAVGFRRRRQMVRLKPRFDKWSVLLAAAVAVISCVAVWIQLQEQGTFGFTRLGLPLIVLLATANSFFEEALWRGAVLATLMRLGVAPGVAVVIQALSFGTAHVVAGYPSGLIGGSLAVAFGLALGSLVIRTRSLLLPVCVHVAVDITIFVALFAS